MSAALQLFIPDRYWYKNQNQGVFRARQALDRYIADLACGRALGPHGVRLSRREVDVLRAIARHIDGQCTTQKTIAWIAARMPASDRTVQRALRGLWPNRSKHPDAWARRILHVRPIHLSHKDAPDRKHDWNAPHWITVLIPAMYWTGRPPRTLLRLVTGPASAPLDAHPVIAGLVAQQTYIGPPPVELGESRRRNRGQNPTVRSGLDVSGGGDKMTPKQIDQGSDLVVISETIHPCGSLSTPRAKATPEPPAPSSPPRAVEAAPPAPPSPGGGGGTPADTPEPPALLVKLCRSLFPSHAPIAHRAIAKLRALGWSDDVIASYLRSASKDGSIQKAAHPLAAAVWRAEQEIRKPPKIPKPPPLPASAPRYGVRAQTEQEKALVKLADSRGPQLLAELARQRGRVVRGPLGQTTHGGDVDEGKEKKPQ